MDSTTPPKEGSPVQPPPARRWRRTRRSPSGGPDNARKALYPRRGRAKSVMILPQVHLRKPCYDFYFL